jgi:hypothetical protein
VGEKRHAAASSRLWLVLAAVLLASMVVLPTAPAIAIEKSATGWSWPTGRAPDNSFIGFLARNPNYGNQYHLAKDFVAKEGDPVYAIGDGTVFVADPSVGGFGPLVNGKYTRGGVVIILHTTSAGQPFMAQYGHVANLQVKKDDIVKPGQPVGTINGYVPNHLHFAIHPGATFPSLAAQWAGYTPNPNNTYGYVDPIEFLKANSPAPPPKPKPNGTTATALVTDVSTSMDTMFRGGIKIISAVSSAKMLTSVIEDQARASGRDNKIALSSFSTDAQQVLGLTSDYGEVRTALGNLRTIANTNIGAGLSAGLDQLDTADPATTKYLILLSDGLTNEGLPPEDILRQPVDRAKNAGVKIYTVGFGDAGDIDEDLLRRIASETGGEYYRVEDATKLENLYIRIGISSTSASVLAEMSGDVAQGETADAGYCEVPKATGLLQGVLNWPGSEMELRLTDPKGTVVATGYPGLRAGSTARPVQMFVSNPMAGRWHVEVYGKQTSMPREPFYVVFGGEAASTTPPPVTGGGASADDSGTWVLGLFAALAAVVGWAVYASSRQPVTPIGLSLTQGDPRSGGMPTTTTPFARLIGPGSSSFNLAQGANYVGRSSHCDVVLGDPVVSRTHARIVIGPNKGSIRDEGSSSGTWVNGRQVTESQLADGDLLRLGDTELTFSMPPVTTSR